MRQKHLLTRFWKTRGVREARHLASPVLWYRRLTAPRRRLPEFVIAGAQKAGTTSLFHYLKGHPHCAASSTKEVHYFDTNFSRGENWYRMHFPGHATNASRRKQAAMQCFESSPYYMFDPRVPARMRETLPGAKVIVLLRNPASRAHSHYQHIVQRRLEPLSFEAAIEAEPGRLAGEHERLLAEPQYQSNLHRNFSYLARGVYVDQLVRWQANFPAEQLLVIEAERMFKRPREVFAEVLEFLGLDPWTPGEFATHNAGMHNSGMSAETRDRLTRYFAPHNERLFELIGMRFDW